MIAPQRIKRILEHYDYDEQSNEKVEPSVKRRPVFILFQYQLSSFIALAFFFLVLLFGSQAHYYDTKNYSATSVTQESWEAR
jgi:hypothetical protein